MRNLKSDWRMLTSPLRMLPDFIIPGEAKCGTTSLYRYIMQHPRVLPGDVKEPNNFIHFGASPHFCRMHYPLRLQGAWARWRHGAPVLTGEASAEYLSKRAVPVSVARVVPQARLVVLMRNPVTRAYSDYQMLSRIGVVSEPFEQVAAAAVRWLEDASLAPLVEAAAEVEHAPVRYVRRGLYARSLRRWLEHFPREQFLFVRSEDLFASPQAVLSRVFAFLGLPDFQPDDFPVRRKGAYAGDMPAGVRDRLARFYEPHNRELYALIGRDMGWEGEG